MIAPTQSRAGFHDRAWRWSAAWALAWAVVLGGCAEPADERRLGLRTVLGSDTGLVSGSRGAGARLAAFAKADRVVEFVFPRDHGPHPEYRSEWWYLTAVLTAAGGREFGVQFTLFRQGIEPGSRAVAVTGATAWRTGQVYMGHVAVSDVAGRRHLEAERLSRAHQALAGVGVEPFHAHIEGWRLGGNAVPAASASGGELWPLRLQAATVDFAINLTLAGGRAVVLQGDRGLSRKGVDNASYYYSIPRIDAAGSVVIDGASHLVAGDAWLDREWGTSVLAPEYAGWDWFALHLDDGRDLMVYRLRRHDDGKPPATAEARYFDGSGVLVDAVGAARTLRFGDFQLAVERRWRGWPVAWRLTVNGGERFVVRAAFEDQVMDLSVRYWEGVVHVEDQDGRRLGSGYMELTGY